MTTNDIRLGFIGTGNISKRHIKSMAELKQRGLGGFVVTAICDINEQALQTASLSLEEVFGFRPALYTDYRELLKKEQVDGIDLCVPHGLHHGMAIDCMEAGHHVLSEKPLGITVKASRMMAEAADRTGRILSTAVPMRRQPGQRTVHWLFNESQIIGRPLVFFHQHAGPLRANPILTELPPAMVWRYDRNMSGGRHAIDSGFHYCDTMRYLFGEVDKVYAELRELYTGTPRPLAEAIEDAVFVTFTFKNGVVGTWTFGLNLLGEASANVMFYGSKGSLRDTTDHLWRIFHLFLDQPSTGGLASGLLTKADGTQIPFADIEKTYMDSLGDEKREFLFPHGVTDGFTHEIWEFIELIRGNRKKPEVDAWEGLRSLGLCMAIYESALSGKAVHVDDVISGRIAAYQAPIDAHWGL